jgi:hypothetical protein
MPARLIREMNSGGFGGADFSLPRRLQPTSSHLSDPARHRLKPMLQAKARATSGCPIQRTDLLSVFLTRANTLKTEADEGVGRGPGGPPHKTASSMVCVVNFETGHDLRTISQKSGLRPFILHGPLLLLPQRSSGFERPVRLA